MHGDHHVAKLLLHTPVVHALCRGTDVWGREKEMQRSEEGNSRFCPGECTAFIHPFLCTLSADRLRHGAGVTEPLSIDSPDDEQVDRIGSQVPDCELGGLHVVRHCLPAVTH